MISCSTRRVHLLAIGYNVGERRRDASYYDTAGVPKRDYAASWRLRKDNCRGELVSLGRLLTNRWEPILLSWSRFDVRIPDASPW